MVKNGFRFHAIAILLLTVTYTSVSKSDPMPDRWELYSVSPKVSEKKPAHSYDECRSPGRWQTMKKNDRGELLKLCQPDTLYLWSSPEKLQRLQRLMPSTGPWGDPTLGKGLIKTLYSARDPVTTFAYGTIPIRIKLKSNIKFMSFPEWVNANCSNVPQERRRDTVFFRDDGRFSDWSICSTDVIHSWSYDTKRHFNEIYLNNYYGQRNWRWMELYSFQQVNINSMHSNESGEIDVDTFYSNVNWSAQTLVDRIANIIARINAGGEGTVYFNPNLQASEKKIENHYSTQSQITRYNQPQ